MSAEDQPGGEGGGAASGAAGTHVGATPGALSDVADFLRRHAPFDALSAADVELVAGSAEIEFHLAGTTIFAEGAEPVEAVRVVRSGAVEVTLAGRVLDMLGPGELLGHASMLSGLPPGFAARAAEDTLFYRIPEQSARELLARPESVGFVARSLLRMHARAPSALTARGPALDPADQPVSALIRDPLVTCTPDTSLRDAAARMSEAGASSIVVQSPDELGILTDRDLRSRVVAGGLDYESPVAVAMSAPAYTVAPDRLGGDVLLEMLDRGIRHFPVVTAAGEVLGVVEAVDLHAVQTLSSFNLRREIGRSSTLQELEHASLGLRPAVIALHDARIAADSIATMYSVLLDAVTRRLVELELERSGPPPAEFAWLALGSQARREAIPGSDGDSAIAWYGGVADELARPYLHALAGRVVEGLARCGIPPDSHGASASDELFVRSHASWERVASSWIANPTQEQALILVSVLVDSRPVWGVHHGSPLSGTFRSATVSRPLLRLLARFALSHSPPTGFMRGLVVGHDGQRRGRLNIKEAGLLPVVDLARWAGMAAGVASASTAERLRAADAAGTLPPADVATLRDAFDLFTELRMEHQVQQLREGLEPDDDVATDGLSPLTRSYLKDSFRAVASVQRRIASELALGVR